MYDIIIIGAGPAGLTSAIYACRAAKKVLVLEAKNYGGQIINTLDIENYPACNHISGFDFATNLYNQAKELGTQIKYEKVIGINNKDVKEVITNKEKYKCKSVIIATGLENRKLGLENEKELVGKGISYCATCDGAFYKNKVVAVVGGGNTAIEDALYLSDICKEVYVIHRRNNFKADEKTINLLKEKSNVSFIYNTNVTKLIMGEKLEKIQITNIDGNVSEINLDGLFIAVGKVPENDSFKDLIKLDEFGYIVANENCNTNISGIFVAGDNRKKELRQLVTATCDGAISAFEAIKYLNNL